MGHHRRQASGLFGRLIGWWSNREAAELQRRADKALWTAKAQKPQIERHADIVTRMARTFGRLP